VQDLEIDLDVEEPHIAEAKLLKAVREFDSYLRAGEDISTAFVESTLNQVISKRMVKNSRCAGAPEERTGCSRSAPASSTTPSPPTTNGGTPASPTPPIKTSSRATSHGLPRSPSQTTVDVSAAASDALTPVRPVREGRMVVRRQATFVAAP
jgi:hypothetical protein